MGDVPLDLALPLIDPHTEAFYTSGRIRLQACEGCGAVQHPPEDVCGRCQGTSFGWRDALGSGTIYSYTIAHYPVHPALADALPYAVVLVQLDDHPHVRITGNLPGFPPEQVRIGLPVRAHFAEVRDPDGRILRIPQWEVAA